MFRTTTGFSILIGLFCIVSRLMTSINYFEDPDSLRFALAVVDYDVAALQPHFPGYPVYVFLVKIFYAISGRLNFSFALIGGIAMMLLTLASIKLSDELLPGISHWVLAILIVCCPLFWLMSNRYMPDLLGLACLSCALVFFSKERDVPSHTYFFLLTGILAGIRLSYLPFLFVPLLVSIAKRNDRLKKVLALAAGIAVWFIPLLVDTGINELIHAATNQAEGHFNEWGGTVITESDPLARLSSFISGIWAHGLGFYWYERSLFTLLTTILFVSLLFLSRRKKISCLLPSWLWWSLILYAAWVLFYQNILFNPRHLMPLILIILLYVSALVSSIRQKVITWTFLLAFTTTGVILAVQHRQPSAMYQAAQWIKENSNENDEIVSTELVLFYMERLGVKARKVDIEKEHPSASKRFYVGNIPMPEQSYKEQWFWHNPYVNLIWPSVKVSVHE